MHIIRVIQVKTVIVVNGNVKRGCDYSRLQTVRIVHVEQDYILIQQRINVYQVRRQRAVVERIMSQRMQSNE
jgi:hypothetical protein